MDPEVRGMIFGRFVYQVPDAGMVEDIEQIRDQLKDMAMWLCDIEMDTRCRNEALKKLEEVSMWANKGIVFRHGTS